ncbi:hypothetical protein M8C21_010231 [Ambrosia artemisiifolia]|uniref:Uncharacterized protein n=1 Tax=Ambrosia artemisiifolia TaxID=4212 RepID=A0AAD5G4N5_AMBAR|nr:hypothetical protein M8C21_010231 [Ambrosia artemisiifolia]
MEEVADKTGGGQEKGGGKTIKKGSGSVGEITSLKLCPSHSGFKDKYGQADKQGHSEARKKLSRPVAQTNVRKDKSHEVATKLQINERVESDGAGNDTENREGGVNEMQKGTTAIDDIPSFSLGSLSTDKCESLGVEFGVNEGVQADVTVRITDDTNNLLKEPRSHEKGDQKSMVVGSNDVDDCPNFSLGLSQVEKKTIVADSGAKSGNEERACRFQFIPAYMLEKDHNKKVSEQTSNVNETTKKEAKGNKGKNVISLCETEMVDNVTDCELPTFDLGLTPSEYKTLKETSEGDHSGLEAAKLKCRLLAEETARKRDICISLMDKARRNPFTEKTVRRVDIASNVTKEEDDVWKFIFNNQGLDAADGNQRKSKLKGEMKVDTVGEGSKASCEEQGSDWEVLFRSAYGVEANRSVFKSLAAKTRVIDEVINCWVEVLNFEERYKEAGSVSRLFVGTKAIKQPSCPRSRTSVPFAPVNIQPDPLPLPVAVEDNQPHQVVNGNVVEENDLEHHEVVLNQQVLLEEQTWEGVHDVTQGNVDDELDWNLAYELLYPQGNNQDDVDAISKEHHVELHADNTRSSTFRPNMVTPEWAKGYETDPSAEYVDWSDGENTRKMEWEWAMHDPWEDERGTDSDCSFDSIFSY